ncbi:MAG: hypothetical protein IJN44_06385 [Clostridia bacterium]|nr:hypothetical protein [Clostridia bacterium]
MMDSSASMLDRLNADLASETDNIAETEVTVDNLAKLQGELKEELKITKRQRIRDIMKHPEQEKLLEETYDEMEADLQRKIDGLENQIQLLSDKRNTIIQVNRTAKTAIDVFRDILEKDKLDRTDLELIISRIYVFEDHLELHLQSDIDALIRTDAMEDTVNFNQGIENLNCRIVQTAKNQKDKVFDVHVISDGDPLEIYTDRDGEVILKKYSPIGEMSSFAKDYTESLFRSMGHIACIVDRDQVVAASGVSKKELWDKPISPDLESAIQARQTMTLNRTGGSKLMPVTNEEDTSGYTAQVVSPIIADGEAIGAVVLLSREQNARMGDTEVKVAETAASIVGRQMEQ